MKKNHFKKLFGVLQIPPSDYVYGLVLIPGLMSSGFVVLLLEKLITCYWCGPGLNFRIVVLFCELYLCGIAGK